MKTKFITAAAAFTLVAAGVTAGQAPRRDSSVPASSSYAHSSVSGLGGDGPQEVPHGAPAPRPEGRTARPSHAPLRRASRERSAEPVVRQQIFAGAADWASQPFSVKVANCESADLQHWPYSDGSRYLGGYQGVHLRSNPRYRGKWQMGFSEWRDTGGVGDPADASEAEQDGRAYRLWKSRGWQPWVCARKV